MSKLPLINTHTHIFTEKNIAPLIAKKFLPWPFYLLLHIGIVFRIFKFYKWVKKSLEPFWAFQTKVISWIRTHKITRLIDYFVPIFLTLNVIMILIDWTDISDSESWIWKLQSFIESGFLSYLVGYNIGTLYQVIIIVALVFLYPGVAKLLWSLARKILSPLKYVPSSQTLQFIQRYLTIAEFAKYKTQKKIFDRLIKMYEPGSKVVVLPMDMEYMRAWKPAQSYIDQINDLFDVIDKQQSNVEYMIPFVFVDPRRIRDKTRKIKKRDGSDEEHPFFDWDIVQKEIDGRTYNEVVLNDCFLRDCLEGKDPNGELNGHFKGIKIYPALGYYPFDEDLLPLWAYCVQHDLPITTHCIEGTIFYRGRMEKKWMHHPIFKFTNGNKLPTKVKSNQELQINFTHPLNYLVLLEEHYLAEKVGGCSDKVRTLFGYNKETKKISQNLEDLKINLAHYGGKEEWMKYQTADRTDLSAELMENPSRGAELFRKQNPEPNENLELYSKPAWIWDENFEWFTIISSLMLQYPNVYADISYVLHNEEVKPLLYQVLTTNKHLAAKILFGTDFFVVRNHKSEKELYAELLVFIGKKSMNRIARKNPNKFLKTK